ncbi:DEAD/DEAH box helicase [Rhizobium sp. SG570]|uniref:SNF2-related protein n=1 Tax=Rhizobium sp. SG570 TaxID=2587113 RepID=UPI0014470053|nr:hypothetical protein [Rhizobium sp. SG570]
MNFDFSFDSAGVTLAAKAETKGLLSRLRGNATKVDLTNLSADAREVAFAIADLRALADLMGIDLSVSSDRIQIPHRLAAAINGGTARTLGMPPTVDFVLRTDAEGIVGSSSFRLRYEWIRNGQKTFPKRSGSILSLGASRYRLPLWMVEALNVADGFQSGQGDASDWEALAKFRQALDPGVSVHVQSQAARASMTDFLSGLEVCLADSFSISPKDDGNFDVVPFSGKRLSDEGADSDLFTATEEMSELSGSALQTFQARVRDRGALGAYRLSPGSYLVVDQAVAPALEVMAKMQHAPAQERKAFIENPQALITDAVEARLRERGKLDGLSDIAQQEAIEAAAGPLLVETKEFSERVTGVVAYEKLSLDVDMGSGSTWLPEGFSKRLQAALANMPTSRLISLRDEVRADVSAGRVSTPLGDLDIPARPEMVKLLDDRISEREELPQAPEPEEEAAERAKGPFVLATEVNFDDLNWHAKLVPRAAAISPTVPQSIRTSLKPHQIESFKWQVDAWEAGLPGILNADEQGLGKTLQTIAFLAWLKEHMAQPDAKTRGPVLVVAPTSLLENWEQEVKGHMHDPGLGHVIRLYGGNISGRKIHGAKGKDTDDGDVKLDFSSLHEAIAEDRAHRFWILTTYTTLTNYQHSLARIPFSAAVFDEIQSIKNPVSLRAVGARAINANFRIGLTGTPIENATVDLWAIMDQLAGGALGTLKEFRAKYSEPDTGNMTELYQRTFASVDGKPPLAIRRLKEDVAKDLPEKTRKVHPRLMPRDQATVYDDARVKLAAGGLGAQLKMLHHIRTVSVHPNMAMVGGDEDFIKASARLSAVIDILRSIRAKNERALVFIEHRQMQYRFIELAKAELGLKHVDLINGETPIHHRQAIVNRFQQHLKVDAGFDLLVLGPKAAGTGLTLTAATHVIHLSRWWNPAVEEQCNDRVHRLGQTKAVSIHLPLAIHPEYREDSFDCLLQSLMTRKRRLASSALWPMGDTQADVAELQKLIGSERKAEAGNPLEQAVKGMFARDRIEPTSSEADGSIRLP